MHRGQAIAKVVHLRFSHCDPQPTVCREHCIVVIDDAVNNTAILRVMSQ